MIVECDQAYPDALEFEVVPAVRQFMAARGLELPEEKTQITNIAEGFGFLGQNVRKYDGKLLIKPARKSVKSLLDRVREIIKGNASITQDRVDSETQPGYPGMGHQSPSRSGETELFIDRPGHMATALEVGKTSAFHESGMVSKDEILPGRRTPVLGLGYERTG